MPIPDVFKEMKVGDALDLLFGLKDQSKSADTWTEASRTPGHEDRGHGLLATTLPRRFRLYRTKDHSGVSGTGYVASGVQFPDGHVAVRWFGKDPSTSLWKDVAALEAVHGHEGSTQIEWLD